MQSHPRIAAIHLHNHAQGLGKRPDFRTWILGWIWLNSEIRCGCSTSLLRGGETSARSCNPIQGWFPRASVFNDTTSWVVRTCLRASVPAGVRGCVRVCVRHGVRGAVPIRGGKMSSECFQTTMKRKSAIPFTLRLSWECYGVMPHPEEAGLQKAGPSPDYGLTA